MRSTISSTARRVPRMTGLPTRICGSTTIRSCQVICILLEVPPNDTPAELARLAEGPFADASRTLPHPRRGASKVAFLERYCDLEQRRSRGRRLAFVADQRVAARRQDQ